MGVTGNWHLVLDSPMGEQRAAVEFEEHDGELTGVLTTVPTRSPASTRSIFSPVILNTMIGTRLSMHSDSAVVSMTLRPRSIACRWVISGMKRASGTFSGSAS